MKICIVGSDSELAQRFVADHHPNNGVRDVFYSMGRDFQIYELENGRIGKLYEDPIDSIVTFPATLRISRLVDMSPASWDVVIEDTLSSVAKSLSRGLDRMNDGGAVVVIGSIVGSTGGYGCSNYSAAKAGLVGLVKSVSQEMLSRKIRINLLELGYVEIGLGARLEEKLRKRVLQTIPMKRFATTDEVMQSIEFLLAQTYMTGNILTVAGGL